MTRTRFSLTNNEMAQVLGISISTLKRLRAQRILRPGKHYLPIGTGSIRPVLKWDPAITEEALVLRSRRMAK